MRGQDAMEVCELLAQYQLQVVTECFDPWIFISCNTKLRGARH